MSVVLPPPLLSGPGGPVLSTLPPLPSPGTASRMAVQQQLLDNLTAELDRQAAQRRSYRLPRDVVDVGIRPETDDMEWIMTEKLKYQRMTANLRRHATSPNEHAAVAKFDRHVNNLATEFRSRYATEHFRQNHRAKQPADRRTIQARYSSNPPLFAGTTTRSSERTITSPLVGGFRTSHVRNVSVSHRHWTQTDMKPAIRTAPCVAVPAGGSTNAWNKVIRPAGPCISRLKPAPAMSHASTTAVATWRSSVKVSQADISMSRSASNRSKADVSVESDLALVDNELTDSDVPHYVQDLIDHDDLHIDGDSFSDVSSEADLMQVDQVPVDHNVDVKNVKPAAHQPFTFTFSVPVDVKEPPIVTLEPLAHARDTVSVNDASVRAVCYWLAIHVVARLTYPEPACSHLDNDEWDLGSVIDRSSKRVKGANNLEPEWVTSPRSVTPVHPYRVYGKIPADPFNVLQVHGNGLIIKPDSQFVNFLVHLIYEKEIAIETIVAAARFIDAIPVHTVDGEFGRNLREALAFANPGESYAMERRLVMIGLYLADISVSDNHWALSAWADSCMIPRPQARLIERHALATLHHSVTITPKAWLDHCSHVYKNVARLHIADGRINRALLEVCHTMVSTARAIVDSNAQYSVGWTAKRPSLAFEKTGVDTSRMATSESLSPDADDDEYEEFDGAGNFPQPVFPDPVSPVVKPFHRVVQPPAQVKVVESDFSAPALQAALVAVSQAPDNRSAHIPVIDDDESDYEPYDGAGHFPMPAIQGRNVTTEQDYHSHNPAYLRHPRAVPRSPVQLARVRPVLNRFETMAAILADAPYSFPPSQRSSNYSSTARTSRDAAQTHAAPRVVSHQYPVRAAADQPLAVPSNPAWPATNAPNIGGDVFPQVPPGSRVNQTLHRMYRNPGFFRERYVPPPTPAYQVATKAGQIDTFAMPSMFGPPAPGVHTGLPPLEHAAHQPMLSPSSETGSPNTPIDHVQVWRHDVAVNCKNVSSPLICDVDRNVWY